ncbi:MAG TPA: cupin domain-containing protein [Thermoanaerobaculia bacterium]|nr:cupin domain-containing protein [Thermoanaerobaculia bacterium]
MLIRKLNPAEFVESYNCQEQMFYPWSEVVATPFGTGWLVLPPGQTSKPHHHHESETFFILRGRGRMTVGAESREVEAGDVIYLPPFGDHILKNISAEDLHFISIWWEDPASVSGLKDAGLQVAGLQEPGAKTAEGAEASAADLPRRLLLVSAGLDGEPRSLPRRVAEIQSRYARLSGAQVRTFSDSPGDASQAEAATLDLFERLRAAGAIASRPIPVSADEADEGARPRLSLNLAGREEAILAHSRHASLSPRLCALVEEAIAEGLAELAISEAGEGGIRVPLPGLESQRFSAPFVRAARLLAAVPDGETPVVFLSSGEAFHYAVLLPALAEAAGFAGYSPAALVEYEDLAADLADLEDSSATPDAWRPWLAGLAAKVRREHDGRAASTQAWTRDQQRFVSLLLRQMEAARAFYEPVSFSPRDARRLLSDLVDATARFAAREEPWGRFAHRREERNTGVALELWAAKILAVLAYPLLPDWSVRLWRCLGYSVPLEANGWEATPAWVPSGQAIEGLEALASGGLQPATRGAA